MGEQSAACAAGAGVVDLSESEYDDTVGILTSVFQEHPQPRWENYAPATWFTNTLTTLALAGVPALNASREEVRHKPTKSF